jgi:hypothetical protein
MLLASADITMRRANLLIRNYSDQKFIIEIVRLIPINTSRKLNISCRFAPKNFRPHREAFAKQLSRKREATISRDDVAQELTVSPFACTRNDVRHTSAFPRRYARVVREFLPPKIEGVGSAGCAMHPAASRARVESTRVSHREKHRLTRRSRTRMVLTVSFVLSLVSRACCHHRQRDCQSNRR